MAYFSGQGNVTVAPLVGNEVKLPLLASYVSVGNVPDFKVSLATTVAEHKESTSGNRLTDGRLIKENKATVSMTLEDMSIANLTLALYGGTVTTVSEPTTQVAAPALTAAPAVFMFTGAPTYKAVRFDGKNTANSNSRVIVDLFKVMFDPLKTLDIIQDDFAKWQLEGSAIYSQSLVAGSDATVLGGFGRVIVL
jgi:hypothetical protein